MKYPILSVFSPAETTLLKNGKGVSGKELMKLSFLDLLLKNVIHSFRNERQLSSRETISVRLIEAGNAFNTFKAKPHEEILLSPFRKSQDIRILFRHFVQMAFDNAKSEKNYLKLVLKSSGLQPYVQLSLWHRFFGGFTYTPKGEQKRNAVESELMEMEKELQVIMYTDRNKALEIISQVGGNIFLLKNLNFDLLREIDEEIAREMERKSDPGSGCTGCGWFVGCWGDYSWGGSDSGCSGGGDSGCSGSGCSGCSGCGGCGGCS